MLFEKYGYNLSSLFYAHHTLTIYTAAAHEFKYRNSFEMKLYTISYYSREMDILTNRGVQC